MKVLKHIFFIWILMAVTFAVRAQSEWIDFSKTYYRIPTSEDGVHRISFTALSASGINPNVIDPRSIRVFHRGKEVSIFVAGEQDGKFDPNDYIDFFGKRNDGFLDAQLYKNPAFVGNTEYNTHNDTTAFFLVISPGTVGKRMRQRPAPTESQPQISQYTGYRKVVFDDQYNLSYTYFPGVRLSTYEEGQGWMSVPFVKGTPRNITFNNLGRIAAQGQAKIEIGLTGRSENQHLTVLSVGASVGSAREVGRFSFRDYQAIHRTVEFNASDFDQAGNLTVRLSSEGPEATDNVSIAYIKLYYPKLVSNGDFANEIFIVGPGEGQVQLDNMLADYYAYDISDPLNPERITVVKTGDRIAFSPATADRESTVWTQSKLNVREITLLTPVRFRDLLSRKADYIFLSHRQLRRPTSTYADPVTAFAEYRHSAAGGGFDTLVVNIDELYDQFTFGEKTPLAIYDFLRKYYARHKPEFFLMIGRSVGIFSTARENNVTYFYRKRPSAFVFQDLIPPAGYPYADNNYSIGLDPENPFIPVISIGRVPARNAQQVAQYLDKVKEKDALGVTQDWQKEIVHLSGGVTAFELERFFQFINGFKDIAEGPYLGGNVTTYRKRSNSTVELINISEDVNNGLSLITFFGHAAPSITDIEIGFVSDPTLGYNNKGKYPLVFLNGCDAGNAFGNAYTFGEDWILTPDKGATNFMAHASLGVDIFLRRYTESFYTKAFADSSLIYQPLGLVKREAEKMFYNRFGLSAVNQSHVEQLVMLGDPAIRLFPADKADYAVKESEVVLGSFEGDSFNALSDSLRLSLVVRNIGRVDLDSLGIKVTRTLPDGTQVTYPEWRFPAIFRRDTLDLVIPNKGLPAYGDNIFAIELNPSKAIPEMTFSNNTVMATRFVPLSGTLNLLPNNYGIVRTPTVELLAQIPGKSLEPRNIVVQLDTAANFTSAIRREIRLTTRDLLKWDVNLFQNVPQKDSITFYWRTRFLDPREGESSDWTVSSFSYIDNGPEGWTQRVLGQLQGNRLENLEIDPRKRSWKYKDSELNLEVFTFGNQTDSLSFRNTQFYLDGVPYIIDNVNNANSRLCPDGSLGLVAFEQKSLTPYLAIPIPGFEVLDSRSCGRVPQVIQSIRNAWITTPGQTILIDYIDALKPGDFVLIFTVGGVTFEQWPDIAFQKLREVGANEAVLRNLKNGEPYILLGRKGMRPGESIEIVAKKTLELEPNQQILNYSTTLQGYFTSASILTPRVGPASDWKLFFNEVKNRNWFNEELAYFDVIGVKENGDEQVLFANIQDNLLDLSSINPKIFPYLRLRYAMEDDASTAPSVLDKWQVNYTGVPEGVLVFKNKEESYAIQEGQAIPMNFEFINISHHDFPDSITVEWTYQVLNRRKTERFSRKIPAVKAGESFEFTIDFNSIGWAGNVDVEVTANPRIFLEQYFRNNTIDLGNYFSVTPDNSTAILDVNFDGVYIMDGDIVSPTVMITALLKNDNSLILKRDTTGLDLFLRKQCEGCQFERMSFASNKVSWREASPNNSFRIEMQPGPLEDGMYTLRIVNNEQPGSKPYEINFEVINEASITNFYPYPNPFSTQVRFVFTVTGSEVPDQIKIQIMTVTGKVVREILQDELGPIRIGNNITEFAWDGRDEFGDQLANGVYIYRVLVRKNGSFVESRATAGDRGFKQGYGKMYLLK